MIDPAVHAVTGNHYIRLHTLKDPVEAIVQVWSSTRMILLGQSRYGFTGKAKVDDLGCILFIQEHPGLDIVDVVPGLGNAVAKEEPTFLCGKQRS
jgi:hypothetical protein